jgi:hypothetical protein
LHLKNNLIKLNKILEKFFNPSQLQLQLLNLTSKYKKEGNNYKKKENKKNKRNFKIKSVEKLTKN